VPQQQQRRRQALPRHFLERNDTKKKTKIRVKRRRDTHVSLSLARALSRSEMRASERENPLSRTVLDERSTGWTSTTTTTTTSSSSSPPLVDALPTDFFFSFFDHQQHLPSRRKDDDDDIDDDDFLLRLRDREDIEGKEDLAASWNFLLAAAPRGDDERHRKEEERKSTLFSTTKRTISSSDAKNIRAGDLNDEAMFDSEMNEREDLIDDEWNAMLEREVLHVEDKKDRPSSGARVATGVCKKKKSRADDRLAPAEAKVVSASRKATKTTTTAKAKRTREELVLAVRMHEKFREYVEIMMTCRKLNAQTKRERESLETKDKEFLAKLDAERETFRQRSSDVSPSPTSSSNVTTFTIDGSEETENMDLCRIPDSSFRRDSLERICEDTKFKQELDAFMEHSCENARKFQKELMTIYDETDRACESFDVKMKELTLVQSDETDKSTRNIAERAASKKRKQGVEKVDEDILGGADHDEDDHSLQLSVKSDEAFRKQLLEKYKDDIPALEEDWLNKKPKGKLPKEALIVLKHFWNKKICWPYPTEEDKAAIKAKTTLDATQINNWFINQRKRHWLKMFQYGKSPTCEAESKAKLLEKFGNLEAAIAFCDRNTKSSFDV